MVRRPLPCLFLLLLPACAVHRPWEQAAAGRETLLIEPGKSVGNVRLGMRPKAVERRVGPPSWKEHFDSDDSTYWTWPDIGLSIQFIHKKVSSFFLYSGVKGGYETRDYKPFPGQTAEGITVHSPSGQVIAILGTPDAQGRLEEAPRPIYWFQYDEGIGFSYLVEDNRLVYIYLMKP